MKTIQRTYKAAMVVNVVKDGVSQIEKMYVASYDGYYWKLYDLKGNAVYQFEEKGIKKISLKQFICMIKRLLLSLKSIFSLNELI